MHLFYLQSGFYQIDTAVNRNVPIWRCLCSVLFNSKASRKCTHFFKHSVEWTICMSISNHNSQPNFCEKDANLLCNRSLCQHDFKWLLPFYSVWGAFFIIIINFFCVLFYNIQTCCYGIFSSLSLPRPLSSHKMCVSKNAIWLYQIVLAVKYGIVSWI